MNGVNGLGVDDFKAKFNQLENELAEALKDAYNKGFLDGISTDRPSQTQFNEDHKEVTAYGEDQDMLVLRGDIAESTAARMFREYLKTDCGMEDESIGDTAVHMKRSNVSYELFEGEPTYYVRLDRGGIYECWMWEIEA